MWSDPIADMLTRLRNAVMARKREVVIYPASNFKAAILDVLKREGFIEDYQRRERDIVVKLKYYKGKPVMTHLRRISKPGRRVYVDARSVPWVLNGLGIAVISTSRGVLADWEARLHRVGGELICEVW